MLVGIPLAAIGLLSTVYVRNINQFQTVFSFIISPIYFFSGIFFPIDQMPATLQWIAKCLPLYHGVVLSQSLFWDEKIWETWIVHAPILALYGAVLYAFSYRKIQGKLAG